MPSSSLLTKKSLLASKEVVECVSEAVTFRKIEAIDLIRNDDVICDKTFGGELTIALLIDGSILVNGGYPLSNFSEMCDSIPHILPEGAIGGPTVGMEDDEIAYIYRTDLKTLRLPEVINSMNIFLADPHEKRPRFPFIEIDYDKFFQEQ
jgi:hypothetical protein